MPQRCFFGTSLAVLQPTREVMGSTCCLKVVRAIALPLHTVLQAHGLDFPAVGKESGLFLSLLQ